MTQNATLTIEDAKLDPAGDLDALRSKALVAGGIGALATVAGFFLVEPAVFFRAYLVAWVYCIGFPLGLFMFNMITHLSGGRWSKNLRRIQEAAGRSIWIFAPLALPFLAFGMQELYPWARPEAASDELVKLKADYLKLWFDPHLIEVEGWRQLIPGFYPRQVLYFLVWGFWAWKLSGLSHKLDETGDERYLIAQQRWSAGGLIAFVMVATFASIDWLMSTEPHWFSSLYGPQLLDWQALSAIGLSIPLMAFFMKRHPLDRVIRVPRDFHDYGKWLLAFTMVWGYFTLSQFLIIWSADLPEEVPWYVYRNAHGWKIFTMALVFFTFFLPFLVLLWRKVKVHPPTLVKIAVFILVIRWFDYWWQVAPNMSHDGVPVSVAFEWVPAIGIGGLWLWWMLGDLKNRALIAVEDPTMKEALADG